MSTGDFFGLWLHVIAVVVYGGATVAVLAMAIPAARGAGDAALQRRVLARALRIYDPLAIAALGVVVMSGASNLTTYKQMLGPDFFARMGWLLVWKLTLAFLVIMAGTYVTFGLGHRVVRSEMSGEPADAAWLASMMRRLVSASAVVCILLAATIWLGLELGHPR